MQHPAKRRDERSSGLSASIGVFAILSFAPGFPAGALAQAGDETGRSYAYGSLSFVEGDVWHQRADDFGAHEAERGSPFLPGDRIWTREPGQVELRFAGQVTAWMGVGTKLDYVEGDSPHRLGFWTGSLIVGVGNDAELVVETPGGTLIPQGEGEYRTDLLDDGRTVQFVVYEGIATVSTEWGSVLVGAGQRTVGAEGAAPAPSEEYREHDNFLAWTERRQNRAVRTADIPFDALPEEVREHAHDLHEHGRWRQDVHLGWVWYPTVSGGWAPYRLGRWAYTPFGYTWISYDPWGWAPFHYGRWGHGPYGWYWVPGSVWSPAWVSWSYGYDWIGWAPLNYYGHPVYGFYRYGDINGSRGIRRGTILGTAVPRGSLVNRRAWSFTSRGAIGRPASRNRLAASSLRNAQDARVLARGAVLDRGFRQRAVGPTGMSRSAKATTRRLSNARNRELARTARTTVRAQRVAAPSRAARARSSRAAGVSGAGVAAAAGRNAPSRATARSGGTARGRTSAGRRAARPSQLRGGDPPAASGSRGAGRAASRAGRSARPPRPRASGSGRRGARRPSSVRPGARSGGGARPNAARPDGASRSRPSGASRSRPSGASRSRPSGASRSRPSGASRSRPSGGASGGSRSGSARRRPNR